MTTTLTLVLCIAPTVMLLLTLAAVAWWLPRLSRPEIFFAWTVDASFRTSPVGRVILRRYGRMVLGSALGGVAVSAAGAIPGLAPSSALSLQLAAVLVQVLGVVWGYHTARRHVAPHRQTPSSVREASLRPRQRALPGGWLAQLGPFLILGAVSGFLMLRWNAIPARFPIHWGLDGQPDGWTTRSFGGVFLVPLLGALICLVTAGAAHLMVRGVRRIHASGPKAEGEARQVRTLFTFLLLLQYWLALLLGGIGLLPLFQGHVSSETLVKVAVMGGVATSLGLVLGLALVTARDGHGGWRLAAQTETPSLSEAPPIGDRTPDECWTAGLFYRNPNDPALWVEKRIGIGWTLNLAHPTAWIILGATLVLTVAIPVVALVLVPK